MKYLYIMKCHGFYKIGITNNLRERISALQMGNPYEIILVAAYQFSKYSKAMEDMWHETLSLASRNVRGEWFRMSDVELEIVKESCEASVDALQK